MKDIGSRASWAFGRKQEKFNKLRDNLRFQVATINMMLATRTLERLDVTVAQTAKTHDELAQFLERTSVDLSDLKEDMQAQNLTAGNITSMVIKIFEMISEEVVAPVKVLHEMVAKI